MSHHFPACYANVFDKMWDFKLTLTEILIDAQQMQLLCGMNLTLTPHIQSD